MEQCDLHFWDDVGAPPEDQQIDPKTKGTSAVQFILTSTIVVHTLDLMKTVYVNIFSCKTFDTGDAARFTARWFNSLRLDLDRCSSTLVELGHRNTNVVQNTW